MKLRTLILAGLAAAALFGACSDDTPIQGRPLSLTPAAIHSATDINTRLVAEALWDAQRWLDESVTLSDLRSVLFPIDAVEVTASGANFLVFPQEEDEDFASFLDDVVAFLDERVFLDEAVESTSGTEVVYRLQAATFCDPEWEEADAYEACVDLLDAVELRLSVTSYTEGDLDISVLVGATRREVAVAELHQTMAAVTLRVGPALEAALEIDRALSDDEEYVAPTLSGSGSVRVAVRRLTDTRTRVAVEIPGEVEVHATMPDEDEPFALSSGPGSIGLDVDRTAETGQLDVDLRGVSVSGPKALMDALDDGSATVCVSVDGGEEECFGEPIEEEEPLTGTFEVQMTRVAGLVDLSDELQEVVVTGLILGPVVLGLDDARVFGADIDGGLVPVDLTLTASEERADIALSHEATLSTVFRMAEAADVWPNLAESFMAHDDLTATVAGDAPWLSVRDAGLVMESGTLTLTSSARPDLDRTLEAGICAWYDDDWGDSGGAGAPSASSSEGAPKPPGDDEETSGDEGHPFDFETGADCPAGEEIPPPTASGGAS